MTALACMEAEVDARCHTLSLSTLCLEQSLSLNLELALWLDWLVSNFWESTGSALPGLRLKCELLSPTFAQVLEIQTGVLICVQ